MDIFAYSARKPSERIEAILSFCQNTHPLYDLCCDHGLIGMHALQRKHTNSVVFVDILPHLVEQLRTFIEPRRLPTHNIHFACADISLFSLLHHNEPVNIVIAGVGAKKCETALNHLAPQAYPGSRFICQVNRNEEGFPEQVARECRVSTLSFMETKAGMGNRRPFYVHCFEKN